MLTSDELGFFIYMTEKERQEKEQRESDSNDDDDNKTKPPEKVGGLFCF